MAPCATFARPRRSTTRMRRSRCFLECGELKIPIFGPRSRSWRNSKRNIGGRLLCMRKSSVWGRFASQERDCRGRKSRASAGRFPGLHPCIGSTFVWRMSWFSRRRLGFCPQVTGPLSGTRWRRGEKRGVQTEMPPVPDTRLFDCHRPTLPARGRRKSGAPEGRAGSFGGEMLTNGLHSPCTYSCAGERPTVGKSLTVATKPYAEGWASRTTTGW